MGETGETALILAVHTHRYPAEVALVSNGQSIKDVELIQRWIDQGTQDNQAEALAYVQAISPWRLTRTPTVFLVGPHLQAPDTFWLSDPF